MKPHLSPLILTFVLLLTACKSNDHLTYDVQSGDTTLNGKEISPEEAIEYFESDQNSDSDITVTLLEGKEKEMKVSEFLEDLEQIITAINEYYHPFEGRPPQSQSTEGQFDPFDSTGQNQSR